MSRKLDWSKLKISDKVITTEKALKDVEPWIDFDKKDNTQVCMTIRDVIQKAIKESGLNEIEALEYLDKRYRKELNNE